MEYKETEFYKFNQPNPHNRKRAGDCVIRAISIALNQSWETTYKDLTELGLKKGYMPNDKKLFSKYLEDKGFVKCPEPRNWDNTKMKVYQFLKYNHEDTVVILAGSHHLATAINGVIQDTWNSSLQTMHCYWRKK